MKLSEALAKLEAAELRADHMPKTRESYRRVIVDYASLLAAGKIDGAQGYIDFLADTRKLHWQTIRKALSPLHFFHVHVLGREMGELKLPRPRKTPSARWIRRWTGNPQRCRTWFPSNARPDRLPP